MSLTLKQWNAFLAVLLQNVDPEVLDHQVLQTAIVGNPQLAGTEFTRFLQNGCRVNLGGLKVATATFDPAEWPGADWQIIAEEHDARNDNLTEVDFNNVDFVTCLKDGETSITGEEKLRRLKASAQVRYGGKVHRGLWLDYEARKENSVLESLYRLKQITWLDFFGDVIKAPGGRRCVLYFYRGVGGWDRGANWLDDGWDAGSLSAVSQVASDPLKL